MNCADVEKLKKKNQKLKSLIWEHYRIFKTDLFQMRTNNDQLKNQIFEEKQKRIELVEQYSKKISLLEAELRNIRSFAPKISTRKKISIKDPRWKFDELEEEGDFLYKHAESVFERVQDPREILKKAHEKIIHKKEPFRIDTDESSSSAFDLIHKYDIDSTSEESISDNKLDENMAQIQRISGISESETQSLAHELSNQHQNNTLENYQSLNSNNSNVNPSLSSHNEIISMTSNSNKSETINEKESMKTSGNYTTSKKYISYYSYLEEEEDEIDGNISLSDEIANTIKIEKIEVDLSQDQNYSSHAQIEEIKNEKSYTSKTELLSDKVNKISSNASDNSDAKLSSNSKKEPLSDKFNKMSSNTHDKSSSLSKTQPYSDKNYNENNQNSNDKNSIALDNLSSNKEIQAEIFDHENDQKSLNPISSTVNNNFSDDHKNDNSIKTKLLTSDDNKLNVKNMSNSNSGLSGNNTLESTRVKDLYHDKSEDGVLDDGSSASFDSNNNKSLINDSIITEEDNNDNISISDKNELRQLSENNKRTNDKENHSENKLSDEVKLNLNSIQSFNNSNDHKDVINGVSLESGEMRITTSYNETDTIDDDYIRSFSGKSTEKSPYESYETQSDKNGKNEKEKEELNEYEEEEEEEYYEEEEEEEEDIDELPYNDKCNEINADIIANNQFIKSEITDSFNEIDENIDSNEMSEEETPNLTITVGIGSDTSAEESIALSSSPSQKRIIQSVKDEEEGYEEEYEDTDDGLYGRFDDI